MLIDDRIEYPLDSVVEMKSHKSKFQKNILALNWRRLTGLNILTKSCLPQASPLWKTKRSRIEYPLDSVVVMKSHKSSIYSFFFGFQFLNKFKFQPKKKVCNSADFSFLSDPGRIQTCNPQSRNLIFYSVELRGLKIF